MRMCKEHGAYAATVHKYFNEKNAKLKVAHLLGHFRPEITEIYLS